MRSPILIGPRCVGKTSVGKSLAERLNVPFIDADKEFEKNHESIADFVKKYGWNGFREEESRLISYLCEDYAGRQIVLAPGGGAVAHDQGDAFREKNREQLRSFGTLFYLIPSQNLEESALILSERLAYDPASVSQRPSLTKESDQYKEMLAVLNKRNSHYASAAHHILYTGSKQPDEITKDILKLI